MEFPKRGCLTFLLLAAIAAITLALFFGCGRHAAGPLEALSPGSGQPPAAGEESAQRGDGQLAGVWALDGRVGPVKTVAEEDTLTSQGWAAYLNEQAGTTSLSELSLEPEGTALALRVYAPGEYAYAVYGQAVGGALKPLTTLIAAEVCDYGGGRDDDIPLVYYVGLADYSAGTWRWFGPFTDEDNPDAELTVNSEALRSRFTSPGDNFYLCVLTSASGKAASSLPETGLLAPLPVDPSLRAVSADEDAAGVKIEIITTTIASNLYTEPSVVTGLQATTSSEGVTLGWDANPDPDVDIYQIFRRDPDTEEPRQMIATVLAPDRDISDSVDDPDYPRFHWEIGVPGKEYHYAVRAHNDAGYGGYSSVSGIRGLASPTVSASSGSFPDYVRVEWTAVEGAVQYALLRGDAPEEAPVEAARLAADEFVYEDSTGEMGQTYYYWVQALGEDENGPLGGPDAGFRIELEPVQVTATDGSYPHKVALAWGTEPLAEEYNVYWDTDEDEAGATYLGTTTAPTTTYDDATAPWDTPRFYFVKPVVLSVEQPRGTGDWGHRGLAIPTGVAATQGTNAAKIVFTWGAVNNATRYKVYRSTTPGDPTPTEIAEVDAPQASYDDTPAGWGTAEGVHYYYSVAALHTGPDSEASARSAEAEGWRGIGTPTGVAATDGSNTAGVNVAWNAVSQATHYKVYRSTVENSPSPTLLTTVAAPSTGYNDTAAAHDTLYWYSVSALYNSDAGALSDDNSGYRGLEPPLNVQASDDLEDEIEITWSAVTGATAYAVFRSTTQTGTYTQIGTDTASPYADGPFTPPVTYWYKLKATGSLATSAFSAADEGRITVWRIVTVDSAGDTGWLTSLAVVNGNPAISYLDNTNFDLKFVRANDASGSLWESPVTVDGTGNVGEHSSLAIVNGNPAICYFYNTSHDLRFTRANDASGSSWGSPVTVDSAGSVGECTSLAIVNGNPAISYYDYTNLDLKFVRANDASGGSWGTPISVDTDGWVGQCTSLAIVSGNPAISYWDCDNDDVKYVRANDASGSSWGTPVAIDIEGVVGAWTSLAVVNGYPAISYWDYTLCDLKYVRANNATGGDWGAPVTVDSNGDVGQYTSLVVVNGKPAISYYDRGNSALKYVRAADTDGVTWGVSVAVDSAGAVGKYSSLAVVNGHPSISCYDETNGDLKFAIYY